MYTKKLVIAALFAAVAAQPPPAENNDEAEERDLGDKVREQIRDKFKQQVLSDLGVPKVDDGQNAVEEVICDQGDDGLWEAAQDQFLGLVKKLKEATDKKQELADKLEPLENDYKAKKLISDGHRDADNTKNALAAYRAAYDHVYGTLIDDSKEWVEDPADPPAIRTGGLKNAKTTLHGETTGLYNTADTNMKAMIKITSDIETAVKDQRDRVEHLVEIAVHQKAEAASWKERVETASTAFEAADVLRVAADDALQLVEEQLTKRSWLQRTLGYLDTAQWHGAGCDVDGNKLATKASRCEYAETETQVADQDDATIRTWAWPADNHCDYVDVANGGVTRPCKMLGLYVDGGSGLYQAAITAIGDDTTADTLAKAFFDKDYSQATAPDTTKQADALSAHLAWQKAELLSETMLAMCYKADGLRYGHPANVWCQAKADGTDTDQQWHPLIQDATASSPASQAFRAAATATKLATYNSAQITATMHEEKAKAQANLLVTRWMALAYLDAWQGITDGTKQTAKENVGDADNTRLIYDQSKAVGRRAYNAANLWEVQTKEYVHGADRATTTFGTWAESDLGKAEEAQAAAKDAANALQMQRDALKSFQGSADTDVVNADNDVTRAQVLLEGLVAEIAPAARDEIETRNIYEAILKTKTEQEADELELGSDTVGAMTGAYEILNQAKMTNDDLAEQQEFHDARTQWSMDKMTPTKTLFDAASEKVVELTAETREAHGMLEAAKERCKAAAFEMAQEALKKSAELAEQRKLDIADVKEKYDDLAKFPEGGVAGSLCHYPKTPDTEAQKPRVPCLEGDPENPLCCGAAQRFLKDGTKLSIETCQPRDSTTYKYYPALPKDALIAPTPETWRFQCISAAQKLAAAAAAALAAGYMMA